VSPGGVPPAVDAALWLVRGGRPALERPRGREGANLGTVGAAHQRAHRYLPTSSHAQKQPGIQCSVEIPLTVWRSDSTDGLKQGSLFLGGLTVRVAQSA
jgi:hypothetical protein